MEKKDFMALAVEEARKGIKEGHGGQDCQQPCPYSHYVDISAPCHTLYPI